MGLHALRTPRDRHICCAGYFLLRAVVVCEFLRLGGALSEPEVGEALVYLLAGGWFVYCYTISYGAHLQRRRLSPPPLASPSPLLVDRKTASAGTERTKERKEREDKERDLPYQSSMGPLEVLIRPWLYVMSGIMRIERIRMSTGFCKLN